MSLDKYNIFLEWAKTAKENKVPFEYYKLLLNYNENFNTFHPNNEIQQILKEHKLKLYYNNTTRYTWRNKLERLLIQKINPKYI